MKTILLSSFIIVTSLLFNGCCCKKNISNPCYTNSSYKCSEAKVIREYVPASPYYYYPSNCQEMSCR